MTERKMLSELNLTNRFLFAQTMEYTEAYEALVSILLEEDEKWVRNICDMAAEFAPEYEFDLVYEKIKRI